MPGDSVLVEAISTVGLLASITLTALVNQRVGRVAKDARSTRAQLENDHVSDPALTGNTREDMDQKHEAQMHAIKTIGKDIGGIRAELRDDRQAARETANLLNAHIKEGH